MGNCADKCNNTLSYVEHKDNDVRKPVPKYRLVVDYGYLHIKILNEAVRDYYTNYKKTHETDSGIDTVVPKEYVIPARSWGNKIELGIACEPHFLLAHQGYEIRARSSLSKTPIRLGNCVGTIDHHYRGELLAVVDNISDKDYTITAGSKLFQIVCGGLVPFKIVVVDELSETERGSGGFGSTGLNVNLTDNSKIYPKIEPKIDHKVDLNNKPIVLENKKVIHETHQYGGKIVSDTCDNCNMKMILFENMLMCEKCGKVTPNVITVYQHNSCPIKAKEGLGNLTYSN